VIPLTVVAGVCIVAVLAAQALVLSRITSSAAGDRPMTAGRAVAPSPRPAATSTTIAAAAEPVAAVAAAAMSEEVALAEEAAMAEEPVAAEDAGWGPVSSARSRTKPPKPRAVAPAGGPLATVVDVMRRRPSVRRGVSIASLVAVAAAIGMLGYPFFTNLVQGRIQDRLERELEGGGGHGDVELGDGLVRVTIPSLRVRVVVVEGTTSDALKAGAGHYEHTALPCQPGNVGIAGHRTTYGRPFHDLDLLRAGNQIVLETPTETCTYEVTQDPWITTPRDIGVLASSGDSLLTLTTCHPKGSARQRLVVQARLVSTEGTSS
jgi:sortase A